MKKSPEMCTWEVSRIKGTPAVILGRINAPDAETAVKEWIEKFGITDRTAGAPGASAGEMSEGETKTASGTTNSVSSRFEAAFFHHLSELGS